MQTLALGSAMCLWRSITSGGLHISGFRLLPQRTALAFAPQSMVAAPTFKRALISLPRVLLSPLPHLCSYISTTLPELRRRNQTPSSSITSHLVVDLSPSSSPSTFEWNTRLKDLVKLRRLAEARALFDKMSFRDAVSWTTLLSGYVAAGDAVAALRLFSLLRLSPLPAVDSFLLSLVLKACGLCELRANGKTLHAYSEKSGMAAASVFVGTALLDMYAKLGHLICALQLFDEMPQRNVVSWTSIITALVHAGHFDQALRLFSQMPVAGVDVDSHTLAIVLKACADSGFLSSGMEIHGYALKFRLDSTSFVANALASMYCKCGKVELGIVVFSRMSSPDVVSWTSLIATYLNQGRGDAAIKTFMAMEKTGNVLPNEYTYSAAISACTGLAELRIGEQLHARTLRAGLARSASASNAIITLYSSFGRINEAEAVFHEMNRRDFVTWSAMICGQAQEGRIEQGFKLLRAMRRGEELPNEVTIGSLLSGCGDMAMLSQGHQLHAHTVSTGLGCTAMVRSSLISMYSRCGSLPDARQVFEEIPCRDMDLVSWTAMLSGYAEHGCGLKAIALFEQMLAGGFAPDDVSFLSVLSACCHEGLLELGFRFFRSMKEKHGIEPGKEHYGCVVDLLCRAGEVDLAEIVAASVPAGADDGVVWSMLLRACRANGQAEKGRRAAEKVLAAQPRCAGTHVELCNMYAAAGRWRDAAHARKMMREKGVKKETGSSWITIAGEVAVFAAADRRNRETERIYAMLEILGQRSRRTEEDEEEEEESSFFYPS